MDIINNIKLGFIVVATIIGGLLNPTPIVQPLGASIPTPVASFTTSLASKITSTDTSMALVSTSTDDGTTLVNGSIYGFVIDVGTSDEEYVLGTASSSNIVSMTRGVSVVTGNTSVASLKKDHRRGASIKITDAPVLLVLARIMNGDETLPNILKYDTPKTFTASSSLVDKNYVDNVAVAGGAVATESVAGLSILGSQSQLSTGTATSSYNSIVYSLVPQNKFFNATPSATTTGVVTGTGGTIAAGFIATSSNYVWSGANTHSGANTFSATTSLQNTTIGGTTSTISSTNLNITSPTTTFTAIPILPASNPTTDNQAARKAYVDTKVTGIATTSAISVNTYYYATTSGIAVISGTSGSGQSGTLTGLIGLTTSTIASVISWTAVLSGASLTNSLTFPVPTGYWYQSTMTGTGSSGGGGLFFPFSY